MQQIACFLNSDRFLDCCFMAIIGLLAYLLSALRRKVYTPVKLPQWVVRIVGVRAQRDGAVDLNAFASQLLGLLLMLLALVVTLIWPSHAGRLYAFAIGSLATMLCVGLMVICLKLKR